jgi:hypothetical protein
VACASTGKSQTVSPFPRVSQMTTTSKAPMSFLGRTLPAAKRKPFHDFAVLAEAAAKQEGPEEITCSLSSVDDSWIQHVRVAPSGCSWHIS